MQLLENRANDSGIFILVLSLMAPNLPSVYDPSRTISMSVAFVLVGRHEKYESPSRPIQQLLKRAIAQTAAWSDLKTCQT